MYSSSISGITGHLDFVDKALHTTLPVPDAGNQGVDPGELLGHGTSNSNISYSKQKCLETFSQKKKLGFPFKSRSCLDNGPKNATLDPPLLAEQS